MQPRAPDIILVDVAPRSHRSIVSPRLAQVDVFLQSLAYFECNVTEAILHQLPVPLYESAAVSSAETVLCHLCGLVFVYICMMLYFSFKWSFTRKYIAESLVSFCFFYQILLGCILLIAAGFSPELKEWARYQSSWFFFFFTTCFNNDCITGVFGKSLCKACVKRASEKVFLHLISLPLLFFSFLFVCNIVLVPNVVKIDQSLHYGLLSDCVAKQLYSFLQALCRSLGMGCSRNNLVRPTFTCSRISLQISLWLWKPI